MVEVNLILCINIRFALFKAVSNNGLFCTDSFRTLELTLFIIIAFCNVLSDQNFLVGEEKGGGGGAHKFVISGTTATTTTTLFISHFLNTIFTL